MSGFDSSSENALGETVPDSSSGVPAGVADKYDATNSVRLCAKCEDECGVSAGADAGDRACACCGQHDAPHVYPALPFLQDEGKPGPPSTDREARRNLPEAAKRLTDAVLALRVHGDGRVQWDEAEAARAAVLIALRDNNA